MNNQTNFGMKENNKTNTTNTTNTPNANKLNNNKLKTNNSKTINQPQSGYSGSYMFGIILLLVIVCIIGYASYWLYNYYATKTFTNVQEVEVLSDVTSANNNKSISSSSIPNSSFSNEYSISFWINITDFNYNYGREKVILRRGDKGSGNPEIVLAAKTNDLIVRVKLQGAVPTNMASSSSSFIDIPISLELDNNNYISSDLSSNNYKGMYPEMYTDMNPEMNSEMYPEMYTDIDPAMTLAMTPEMTLAMTPEMTPEMNPEMTPDMNSDMNSTKDKTGKENFNITSNPDTVHFPNYNFKELESNNLGNNTIDYPTIQYISDNPSLNNEYFKMISGNSINEHTTSNPVETFDNITDAANAIAVILTDLCDIATYLKTSKVTDDYINSINIIFTSYIDLIESLRAAVKADTPNKSNILTQFNSKMKTANLLSDNDLSKKFSKLNVDIANLKNFTGVVVDYTTLQKTVNVQMKAINCPLIFEGTTEIDGQLSFLGNAIVLLKETLYTYLKNLSTSIQNNPNIGGATNIELDPTIGTCVSKMIPQQKWVNVIVSVYNQVIDIYIDGQLSTSRVLKKFPDISTSAVTITPDGGFSGLISRVKFTNSAMTVQGARAIYYDGPIATQSLFSLIPSWAYWTILAVVIISIIYSFVM
jgi:hypothetical protein